MIFGLVNNGSNEIILITKVDGLLNLGGTPITDSPIKCLSILNNIIKSSNYFRDRRFWVPVMSINNINVI